MTPRRIQRRRTKGWRMPEGAVYVGRPTRWGNPIRVGFHSGPPIHHITRRQAVEMYRAWLDNSIMPKQQVADELRGRDLVCWCPLHEPCHADVLLEVANA